MIAALTLAKVLADAIYAAALFSLGFAAGWNWKRYTAGISIEIRGAVVTDEMVRVMAGGAGDRPDPERTSRNSPRDGGSVER